jgi:hypothetical protein
MNFGSTGERELLRVQLEAEPVAGGGSPNVQKKIVAERVLGMPKD